MINVRVNDLWWSWGETARAATFESRNYGDRGDGGNGRVKAAPPPPLRNRVLCDIGPPFTDAACCRRRRGCADRAAAAVAYTRQCKWPVQLSRTGQRPIELGPLSRAGCNNGRRSRTGRDTSHARLWSRAYLTEGERDNLPPSGAMEKKLGPHGSDSRVCLLPNTLRNIGEYLKFHSIFDH